MLENEAGKKENLTNLFTFVAAFTLLSIATIMCCYFNYKFAKTVARDVFWLFVLAWLLDMLFFRIIFILIMALFRMCNGKKMGYEAIDYLSTKEVHHMIENAMKDMFHVKPKKTNPRCTSWWRPKQIRRSQNQGKSSFRRIEKQRRRRRRRKEGRRR